MRLLLTPMYVIYREFHTECLIVLMVDMIVESLTIGLLMVKSLTVELLMVKT